MARSKTSKVALCVGINNYPGSENDLRGCVNDANDWAAALAHRGFAVTTLIDADATREKILNKLDHLIQEARPDDEVIFTYSGHGTSIPDDDGDEADGRDEALCPVDVMSGHLLVDDDLAEIFGHKTRGVRLYFISDSCHSGTVARFGPSLNPEDEGHGPRPRFLPPGIFMKGSRDAARLARIALVPRPSRQKYPALLAAACADYELSWDASFGNRPNGAFTYVALDELKRHTFKTPREWITAIRKRLPTARYPQTPRLYGSLAAKTGPMF